MSAQRKALFEVFARHISPGKARIYEQYGVDVVMGARSGAMFADAFEDRRWFNCHCNGGVFNLGHRHPAVISAVVRALESTDIGNHHLVSAHRTELGRRLAATTHDRLGGVVFAAGGGEAVDLAIKLARGITGRRTIVSAQGGYHGHTGLATAAGDPQYREPFGQNLPGFTQVPFDDVDALDQAIGDATAAVIFEPIPATAGMPIPRPEYLATAQRLCRDRGALLVIDEVQTGLGRTGRMWCHEHESLEPDMLVTGKGLSGGIYPIAATLMTRRVHSHLDDHPFAHISTFGGAEPGCAAGLAVLDIVEAPGFFERVRDLSNRFARCLQGLPFTLRRRGLMMGLKFNVPEAGKAASRMLYDAGVFALHANNDSSVLQFLPPLILSDDEADEIIARVRRVLG